MASRLTGKIAWFNRKSGYGFLRRSDKPEDVFVHFKDIEQGTEEVKNSVFEGQGFTFEIGDDGRGRLKAIKVKREPAGEQEKISGTSL